MRLTEFKEVISQLHMDISSIIFVDSNTKLEYDYDDIYGNEQIFGKREIKSIESRVLVNDFHVMSQIVVQLT